MPADRSAGTAVAGRGCGGADMHPIRRPRGAEKHRLELAADILRIFHLYRQRQRRTCVQRRTAQVHRRARAFYSGGGEPDNKQRALRDTALGLYG